jgi:hypothetical protein
LLFSSQPACKNPEAQIPKSICLLVVVLVLLQLTNNCFFESYFPYGWQGLFSGELGNNLKRQ